MGQFIQRTHGLLSRFQVKSALYRLTRSVLTGLLLVGVLTATVIAAGPTVKTAATPSRHWYQIGKASWYGIQFQGRKTATGETYDMNQLTCAHRSLPLGTWLRVTNLHNKKVVYVRVSDRGPEPEDRIVDLSYAAAQAVGINGLGQVRLDRMAPDDPELAKALVAQVHMPPYLMLMFR